MGLREQVEADLAAILEDAAGGFGSTIQLTDPDGVTAELVGLSNDIAAAVDPETGALVAGRSVEVLLRISSIISAGLALPSVTTDPRNVKPWKVRFKQRKKNCWSRFWSGGRQRRSRR